MLQLFTREWLLILFLVFGGCCSNVFALEVLVKTRPRSGHLVTFGQFLVVSIHGFNRFVDIKTLSFKPTKIPIRKWFFLIVLYWTVSVLNNWALSFNMPMPFHIIFRSAGLIITLIMSWIFLKKTYSFTQVAAVIMVTIGILTTTLASSSSSVNNSALDSTFLTGIAILVFALILSSVMGIFQQNIYENYGKEWKEGLFFMHFLSLPAFIFMYSDIYNEIMHFSESHWILPFNSIQAYAPLLSDFKIPYLWFYLIVNVVTQYACISGVQKLSSMTTAVTLNLVLSVRKFISLILSIILFKNSFNAYHWVGTGLVFFGTIWYAMANRNPPKEKDS